MWSSAVFFESLCIRRRRTDHAVSVQCRLDVAPDCWVGSVWAEWSWTASSWCVVHAVRRWSTVCRHDHRLVEGQWPSGLRCSLHCGAETSPRCCMTAGNDTSQRSQTALYTPSHTITARKRFSLKVFLRVNVRKFRPRSRLHEERFSSIGDFQDIRSGTSLPVFGRRLKTYHLFDNAYNCLLIEVSSNIYHYNIVM